MSEETITQPAETTAESTETPAETPIESKPDEAKAEPKVQSKFPEGFFPYSFKVKVDGAEQEVTVKDEADYHRMVQLREASDKRFKEASSLRKQAEDLINLLKKNPRAALEHPAIGHDVRKLAEEVLSQYLEEDSLDPTEKELRDLRRQLADKEKAEKELQAKREQDERDAKDQVEAQRYQKMLDDVFATSKYPKNPYSIDRVITWMERGNERGEDFTVSELSDMLRQDYESDFKSLFPELQPEDIMKFLGPKGVEAVRNWDAKKFEAPEAPAEQPPKSAKTGKAVKKQTLSEKMDAIRKRIQDE